MTLDARQETLSSEGVFFYVCTSGLLLTTEGFRANGVQRAYCFLLVFSRKEKRKSLTDTMRRSLCQQLDEEFHRCEWTEVVKQATRQGWLKFYPLDKDKPPSTVPEFESAGDQISRIIENLKRKNGA